MLLTGGTCFSQVTGRTLPNRVYLGEDTPRATRQRTRPSRQPSRFTPDVSPPEPPLPPASSVLDRVGSLVASHSALGLPPGKQLTRPSRQPSRFSSRRQVGIGLSPNRPNRSNRDKLKNGFGASLSSCVPATRPRGGPLDGRHSSTVRPGCRVCEVDCLRTRPDRALWHAPGW
jgi:hypothetical protein